MCQDWLLSSIVVLICTILMLLCSILPYISYRCHLLGHKRGSWDCDWARRVHDRNGSHPCKINTWSYRHNFAAHMIFPKLFRSSTVSKPHIHCTLNNEIESTRCKAFDSPPHRFHLLVLQNLNNLPSIHSCSIFMLLKNGLLSMVMF